MRTIFLLGILALPLLAAPASGADSCPAAGAYSAVDLSMPVDQPFLDKLKELQVSTVLRYYDYVNETIPGKTLLPDETDLLSRNGFNVAVVFQHHNDQIGSFTPARGKGDSLRALELAALNKQPTGTAIYFGVDGDWSTERNLASIQAYFQAANPAVRTAGFKVGVYGSGLVCQRLMDAGLADYCWLSNAQSWPGFDAFHATNRWSLTQSPPRDCAGKNGDFDFGNEQNPDIGQFRP